MVGNHGQAPEDVPEGGAGAVHRQEVNERSDAPLLHVRYHGTSPAHTRRLPNAGLWLGQRRRRCANIEPTLGQRLAFSGSFLQS